MNDTSAIVAIIVDVGMIIAGLTAKQFYSAAGAPLQILSDKKIPRWESRLIFLVIGGLFVGVDHFLECS